MVIGWPDDRIVDAGREMLGMGPKATARFIAETRGRWAQEDESAHPGEERSRDIAFVNDLLRKLMFYPEGTKRAGRDVSRGEIFDPKDLDVNAITKLLALKASLSKRRGEGRHTTSPLGLQTSSLAGAAELAAADGEEAEEANE